MIWPQTLELWWDPASPYSWLTTHRVELLARLAGVPVAWRPLLLGPIFRARGYSDSPLALDADRGAWMWEDIARGAAALGLPFRKPRVFPAHSVFAARAARVAAAEGWGAGLARALGDAAFSADLDLGDREVVRAAIRGCAQAPDRVEDLALAPANKEGLRADTEEARRRGVFGAPTFLVGSDRFWGDDRLEQALAHAAGPGAVFIDGDAALDALHAAHVSVSQEVDRVLAGYGLRRLHHRILYLCRRHAPLRSGDLGLALGLSKQALSGPLQLLQGRLLLAMGPDPDDGRARRVTLSEAGLALEAQLSGLQREALRCVARGETPTGQLAFLRVLHQLGAGHRVADRLPQR